MIWPDKSEHGRLADPEGPSALFSAFAGVIGPFPFVGRGCRAKTGGLDSFHDTSSADLELLTVWSFSRTAGIDPPVPEGL